MLVAGRLLIRKVLIAETTVFFNFHHRYLHIHNILTSTEFRIVIIAGKVVTFAKGATVAPAWVSRVDGIAFTCSTITLASAFTNLSRICSVEKMSYFFSVHNNITHYIIYIAVK